VSLFPTTLEVDKTSVTRGDTITFTVKAPPFSRVVIYIKTGPGYENVPITTFKMRSLLIRPLLGVSIPYETGHLTTGTYEFVAVARRGGRKWTSNIVTVTIT